MLFNVIQYKKISYLLLVLSILTYILFLKSNTGLNQGLGDNKRFFIDKNGNKIPVFDESTLYPKPGGGYCNMTPIKDKEEYFQALEEPKSSCKNLETYGDYQVCLDGFKKKDNCVVLSFGIFWNFEYEDTMVDKLGCQAYSFDPTMDKGSVPHERKNGKDMFYELGLSSFKGVKIMSYVGRKNLTCKNDRYVNIVKMLGVADKEIDFLKIDIEGSELDFFLDTASNHPELLENVRQIHIEFHNLEQCCYFHTGNRKDTTQFDMMKIVQILHCHGFALTHSKIHPMKRYKFRYNKKTRSCCYIATWIRP